MVSHLIIHGKKPILFQLPNIEFDREMTIPQKANSMQYMTSANHHLQQFKSEGSKRKVHLTKLFLVFATFASSGPNCFR
jgi:hypothetical protein